MIAHQAFIIYQEIVFFQFPYEQLNVETVMTHWFYIFPAVETVGYVCVRRGYEL